MKAHPIADIFPLLEGLELQSLSDDIKAHGLIHPIVVHDSMILDGRNRFNACRVAGIEPKTKKELGGRSYKGPDEKHPTEWSIHAYPVDTPGGRCYVEGRNGGQRW